MSNKTSYKQTLLAALFVILTLGGACTAWAVYENNRSLIEHFVQSQNEWLATYSEVLVNDVQIGDLNAVEKKLQALVSRAHFSETTISIGRHTISAKKDNQREQFASRREYSIVQKVLKKILPIQTIEVPVKDSYGTVWGRFEVVFDSLAIYEPLIASFKTLGLRCLAVLLLVFASTMAWITRESIRLEHLISYFKKFSEVRFDAEKTKKLALSPPNLHILELDSILLEFSNAVSNIIELDEKLKTERARSAAAELAQQVAHDIRSPLAALEIATHHLDSLAEDNRILIRHAISRIRDIANNLLQKHKNPPALLEVTLSSSGSVADNELLEVELLPTIVESIISEKRAEFRSNMRLNLDVKLDLSSYGLFARLHPAEFKRILSNLINNAAEAASLTGDIEVSIANDVDFSLVRIRDTGKGMSPELLSKIGARGFTHEKQGGSGLGLYHAKTTLESWGGKLEIMSQLNQGTIVTLKLPRVPPPDWFIPEIYLEPRQHVLILDDDASIHQVWKGRLGQFEEEFNLFRTHATTPEEFRRQATTDRTSDLKKILFLCDYELIGQKISGLDLIESLGIEDSSILVTSRFEDPSIRARCNRLKIKWVGFDSC